MRLRLNTHNYTIEYYDNNAADYAALTVNAPMDAARCRFAKLIPDKGRVLDFGCGSGRDTKYFIDQGFMVDALDGSAKLARIASEYTGIEVRTILFQEFAEKDRYDGIWACASLLHMNDEDLMDVLVRLRDALKNNGILYASFKYGDYQGVMNGRFYNYMDEKRFSQMLKGISGLEITDSWLNEDSLGRTAEARWLNILMKKTDIQTAMTEKGFIHATSIL